MEFTFHSSYAISWRSLRKISGQRITQKQLKQVAHWLKSSARKCYGHHHELVVVRYEIVISELQRIISILGRFVFISPITDGIFTGLDYMSNAAGVL